VIVRKAGVRRGTESGREWEHTSDSGGLTHYGTYVETLQPGASTSDRHWHEKEDELMYVLSGELTVVENDGEHVLRPGDAACWPAGVANGHSVHNRSSAPATYLIVGTRVTHDVCHYVDSGRTLFTEGTQWRLEGPDGAVIRAGQCKSPPGRD
jgi:uncharacterized cupin superfamily protein